MNQSKELSVVICTRNRQSDLKKCIASLSNQNIPQSITVEVVIIDDGHIDNEMQVDFNQMLVGKMDLVYHQKNRPGLLLSRIEALQIAKHEIILFIDDDIEFVNPNYIINLLNIYANSPEIAGVGGIDILMKTRARGKLFTRFVQLNSGHPGKLSRSGYSASMCKWRDQQRPFETEFLHGCNMSFRKRALANLKELNWLTSYSLGEDIYLSYTAMHHGKLFIHNDLLIEHHQSPTSRDKVEGVAYTEIINHYYLLKLRNAKKWQYLIQIWTAIGLFVRAYLRKNERSKGYLRGMLFLAREATKRSY